MNKMLLEPEFTSVAFFMISVIGFILSGFAFMCGYRKFATRLIVVGALFAAAAAIVPKAIR
jgi:hypothetical protein